MAEPFLSEIRLMSFNFPPKGWALCNGQLLPINQNQALFALLGTTYGGNGQTTFALPNLQAKVPMHVGNGHTLGETAGANTVTLTTSQMPQHTHFVTADSTTAPTNQPTPQARLAANTPGNLYGPQVNVTPMNAASVSNVGGSQAHENRQPFLTLSYCVALQGIFPSPN